MILENLKKQFSRLETRTHPFENRTHPFKNRTQAAAWALASVAVVLMLGLILTTPGLSKAEEEKKVMEKPQAEILSAPKGDKLNPSSSKILSEPQGEAKPKTEILTAPTGKLPEVKNSEEMIRESNAQPKKKKASAPIITSASDVKKEKDDQEESPEPKFIRSVEDVAKK